jgi:hypothetical protein
MKPANNGREKQKENEPFSMRDMKTSKKSKTFQDTFQKDQKSLYLRRAKGE